MLLYGILPDSLGVMPLTDAKLQILLPPVALQDHIHNSMKELEMKEDLNEFKFHYDSINSACNGDWNAYQGHLNSIMILLIPD